MRVGISGAHGTGKTTLAEALCARLPGHVTADEPYYLLGDEGYEFGFPPSPEDYRALLARSVLSLTSPPSRPAVRLRARMNDALLELVYDDPLTAWSDIPVLELSGPLDRRLDTVLAALAPT